MFSAIAGDIIGSIHEKLPSHLSHRKPTPTDDTFLTCACYEWVHSISLYDIENIKDNKTQQKLKETATFFLKKWWKKYPQEGFSRGFSQWAGSDTFIQGHRNTNGSLMRQSPIAQFCIDEKLSLDTCLILSNIFASPTHDHDETYPAVASHIKSIFESLSKHIHPHDLKYINENTIYNIKDLDYWKNIGRFIWDAPQSLAIAYSALYHAENFQEVIDNCIYIGGDVDTYCAIACPIAIGAWPMPDNIKEEVNNILIDYPDITSLIK